MLAAFVEYQPPGQPAAPPPPPPPPEENRRPAGPSTVARLRGAARHPQALAAALGILIGFASVLSAVVAWRASLASIDASRYESLAVQQQARKQQIERDLEGIVAQDLRFVNVFQEHALAARELRTQADSLRDSDPGAADRLDLQAQARMDLARGVRPFFQGAGGAELSDDGTVVYDVAYVLTNLREGNSELRELILTTQRTPELAQRADAKSVSLIGVAAMLVAALFFLTIAQVTRARLSIRQVFFAAGGVLVLVGTLVVRDRRGAGLSGDSREYGEYREREPRDDRLSGIVAVVIAFATLVAAVAGFLQANTGQVAGDKRDEAEQLALIALASAQRSRETAQVELETFAQWVEQRTQAGNAFLASLYSGNDVAHQNELLQEQERWETIAAATLKQSAIDPASEFGPEQDPTFPQRYFAAATEESLGLNALQDAANEEASKLDERAAGYTAVLAMLAVALYLFGLTLAVTGRWLRLGFLSVGVGMLGVALLWMVQSAIAPVYETNDQAAAEYAKGRVARATAYDAAGYATSEQHYNKAIELRPTFARAYAERAAVIFDAASPQRSGFTSIAPPAALARAAADLRAALTLGLENATTLGDLGFYTFAEGAQSARVSRSCSRARTTRAGPSCWTLPSPCIGTTSLLPWPRPAGSTRHAVPTRRPCSRRSTWTRRAAPCARSRSSRSSGSPAH